MNGNIFKSYLNTTFVIFTWEYQFCAILYSRQASVISVFGKTGVQVYPQPHSEFKAINK